MQSAIYLETSAILTWLFNEPKARKVEAILNSNEKIFTSVLTTMESERAIARAHRTGLLKAAERIRLVGLFNGARTGWHHMEISRTIREQVGGSFPVEPVRTLDAIHLASATVLLAAYPDLRVLSFDARIIDNCNAMGLVVC
jgi:hypothetical protein